MDDKLIKEITEFCYLNDIEDVEKQINACLRKGFDILKYGTSPIDNYKIEKNIYGTEDREILLKKTKNFTPLTKDAQMMRRKVMNRMGNQTKK